MMDIEQLAIQLEAARPEDREALAEKLIAELPAFMRQDVRDMIDELIASFGDEVESV